MSLLSVLLCIKVANKDGYLVLLIQAFDFFVLKANTGQAVVDYFTHHGHEVLAFFGPVSGKISLGPAQDVRSVHTAKRARFGAASSWKYLH